MGRRATNSKVARLGFTGHETFPFRITWPKKALDAVLADPQVFGREDALVTLGVGKNMVRSMRHWGLALNILCERELGALRGEPAVQPTDFGRALLSEWDPYLEDPASLWMLHWQLVRSPARTATWYYAFNVLPRLEFTRSDLVKAVRTWAEGHGARAADRSIVRDVDCFVRTYAASRPTRTVPLEDTLLCPLAELGLVRTADSGRSFVLERADRPGLPDELVASVLVDFLVRRFEGLSTIAFDDIAFAAGSPGRVFVFSEEAFLVRLERLERITAGKLAYDETAGLRQIAIRGTLPTSLEIMSDYFQKARLDVRRGVAA